MGCTSILAVFLINKKSLLWHPLTRRNILRAVCAVEIFLRRRNIRQAGDGLAGRGEGRGEGRGRTGCRSYGTNVLVAIVDRILTGPAIISTNRRSGGGRSVLEKEFRTQRREEIGHGSRQVCQVIQRSPSKETVWTNYCPSTN